MIRKLENPSQFRCSIKYIATYVKNMRIKDKIIIAALVFSDVIWFIPAERGGFSVGDLVVSTVAGLIGCGIAIIILYYLTSFVRNKLRKPEDKIFSFKIALIIYLLIRLASSMF